MSAEKNNFTWPEYELVDTGGFEKLERFGEYYVARPEPQALWDKSMPESEWKKLVSTRFRTDKGATDKGEWFRFQGMPSNWEIPYRHDNMSLKFQLGLSSFKHVGLFPEQAYNWNYIFEKTLSLRVKKPKVLNLFAYTGGASLAAKAGGADVTHVDSVKQVISWANRNMVLSGLKDIRWVAEDAVKFVRREVKRGNRYNGVILDPPAYGRGPRGEKWMLAKCLNDLVKDCLKLLAESNMFFVINVYSMGLSHLVLENLISESGRKGIKTESGELCLKDRSGKKLPLGVFSRFSDV